MRRLIVVLGLVTGLVAVAGLPALATPPTRLADQVTDEVGALAGHRDEVDQALKDLRDKDGTQLWVVYVASFDGMDGTQWAEQTAQQSQLGGNDVLFAVAVDDRAYGYWFDPTSDRNADDVDKVISSDVEPKLADEDWPGAVVALADGLKPTNRWPAVLLVAAVIVLVVGFFVVRGRIRRRRAEEERRRAADPFHGEPTESVQGRAATALLEVDEAVRTSQLDLDYGRQQYGDAAVAEAATAIGQARAELEQAFEIRQRLDDEQPEDDDTVRKMLAELLRLADSADARLDAQAKAFADLRDLEKNAPHLVESLGARLAELTARLPQEQATLAKLRQRWAHTALVPADDNDEEARVRLAAAGEALTAARDEIAAGRPGHAAPAVQAAEAAVAEATTLLDAVGRRSGELDAAAEALPAARADAERGLAEARGLVAGPERTGLAEQVARAEQALAEVDALAGAPLPDPLTAMERLQAADRALDEALGRARDEQARQAAARARLDRTLGVARSRVAGVADLIDTRAGRILSEPRTSLSEARRHLAAAEAAGADDAVTAVAEAERAVALAESARQQAERDLAYRPGGGWGGGWSSGYRHGGGFGGSGGSWSHSRSSGHRGGSFGGGRSSGGGHRHGGGGRF